MVDLTLQENDAGGAVLTLPHVTGVTDTLEGVDNAQGLATAQLALSLAAPFTAHDAIEVNNNADSTTPATSPVHGERVLLLNCALLELGAGAKEGVTVMLIGRQTCTVTHNGTTIVQVMAGKVRTVVWTGDIWVLADEQNTSTQAAGGTVIIRNADGRAQVTDPVAPLDIANADYVQRLVNNRLNVTVQGGVAYIAIRSV